MSYVNKVMLLGNIGEAADIKTLDNGKKAANFNMVTEESFKDRSGQKVKITEWHTCVGYGGVADIIEKYTKKGSRIFVEGKLRTRSWDDKNNVKHYKTEILIDKLTLL